MAERQGFMVYHELIDALDEFTDQETGQLFRAMLRYSAYGEIPDFKDRGMRTMWRDLQRRINRDDECYDKKVKLRQYAGYCSAEKRAGRDPLPFEEWRQHMSTHVNNSYQLIANNDFDNQLQHTTNNYNHNQQPQPQPQHTTTTSNIQPVSVNDNGKEIKGGVGEKEETRTIPGLDFPPLSPEEFAAKRDAAILSLRAMMKGVGM